MSSGALSQLSRRGVSASTEGRDDYNPTSPSTAQNETSTSEDQSGTRTRKTVGSITPNACTNCKKARAKCNGGKPTCQRCSTRPSSRPCQYVMHTKALKEELMGEIQHLRTENQHLTQRNTDLGNRNELLEQIFRSLEDDTQRQEVICRLKRGDNYRSIVEWLGQNSAMDGLAPVTQHQLDEVIKHLPQYWDMNSDPWYWMDMYSGDPRYQMAADVEQGQKVGQHVPPSDGVDQT